jgi:hypothetical protein
MKMSHGVVPVIGADALGPTMPVMGDRLGVGTACAALTPGLLISVESRGTPAGTAPLVVVDDVDVGFDNAVMLLEPEPHIPVSPDVAIIPENVDSPEVGAIAVDVDIPDDVDGPDGTTPPDVPAVAAVVLPLAIAIPPPS